MEAKTYNITYSYNDLDNLIVPALEKDLTHTIAYMINNGRVITGVTLAKPLEPVAQREYTIFFYTSQRGTVKHIEDLELDDTDITLCGLGTYEMVSANRLQNEPSERVCNKCLSRASAHSKPFENRIAPDPH